MFPKALWWLVVMWCGVWPARFGGLRAAAAETTPAMPMAYDETASARYRWLQKAVLKSRLLDDMERTNDWVHHGHGMMRFTRERARDGTQSIRLQSPTRTEDHGSENGRPFGEAAVERVVPGEDWSAFNRVSFWVYPNLPGFHAISLLVRLHNDGAEKMPGPYGRRGLNYFLLKQGQWNQIVWEIPDLPRDKVTGLEFVYRLQGNEPEATNAVCFDVDRLELQQVAADHFEGWQPAAPQIAYSHVGYAPGEQKVAIAPRLEEPDFTLLDAATKKEVLKKAVTQVETPLGRFSVLNFSEVQTPGRYQLVTRRGSTKPFSIGPAVWRETAWQILNFFYCERCGAAIPGIHGVCHQDWRARHGDETLVINGGWHDAGDLSQGLVNTAESTQAMLTLAERCMELDPALAGRLVEEAEWGLEWILKTRFQDGARVVWGTMDFWTDNQVGTVDDMLGQVGDPPFDLFQAASAEAVAARILKGRKTELAARSLALARADWNHAMRKLEKPGLELAAAAGLAALELYRTTGEADFSRAATEMGNLVTKCQQRELPDWQTPLTGFFYSDPSRKRILHYFHRSHEQAPIVLLSGLCQEFPRDENWMEWYGTVARYSEYLRNVAAFTAPYYWLPAGVYSLEESADPNYQAQVRAGVKLDANHYLRIFPVWTALRGNYGTGLSMTWALSEAAHLRGDLELANLGQLQLQWVVGRNPFVQSTFFGLGHDFAPQYTALSGNMTGSLPVGVETRGVGDVPYWPASNCYNYKEVWVHPAARWLSLLHDLGEMAAVYGQGRTNHEAVTIVFEEEKTGLRYEVEPDAKTGQFRTLLPRGRYKLRQGREFSPLTLLPSEVYQVDLQNPLEFHLSAETRSDGTVLLKVKADGQGKHRFQLRTANLIVASPEKALELSAFKSETVSWEATVRSTREPWVAVAILDGQVATRKEVFHRAPALSEKKK